MHQPQCHCLAVSALCVRQAHCKGPHSCTCRTRKSSSPRVPACAESPLGVTSRRQGDGKIASFRSATGKHSFSNCYWIRAFLSVQDSVRIPPLALATARRAPPVPLFLPVLRRHPPHAVFNRESGAMKAHVRQCDPSLPSNWRDGSPQEIRALLRKLVRNAFAHRPPASLQGGTPVSSPWSTP